MRNQLNLPLSKVEESQIIDLKELSHLFIINCPIEEKSTLLMWLLDIIVALSLLIQ
jgi:hypothetical protein